MAPRHLGAGRARTLARGRLGRCCHGCVSATAARHEHAAGPPLTLEGGTSFTFVTDGIRAALEQARPAGRGKDVSLAGGANAAQQYLNAALVDEMEIHLVPTLLGDGERLFEGVRDLGGLRLVRTVAAPNVTHLKFTRD